MPLGDKTPQWRHQVVLVDREEMTIDGVVSLGSFDDHEIVLETEQGGLLIKGESLNIKQLNLDNGNVIVEGYVTSISYEEEGKAKKGLLSRLLK